MKFMKNILGLNGCGIPGEHIRCGIMERDCTAIGNSGHSLNQDCGIIAIYLKGVFDGETKTNQIHLRV